MDSCFVLIETHQYCIAKICNASPRANAHKLQNDPFTISSSVPWTHLRPETRAATSRVSRRKETECHDWCLEKAKLNVVGQDQQCQPKHLTVRTTPCLKGAQRIVSALQSIVGHYIFFAEISCRSYVSSVFRMRSLAVSGYSNNYETDKVSRKTRFYLFARKGKHVFPFACS